MQCSTVCKVIFFCKFETNWVCMQGVNQHCQKTDWKSKTACNFLREMAPPHSCSILRVGGKWSNSHILVPLFFFFFSQGYHRPNHYIATQGKNTNFLKIAKALWVWMCGRWEFKAVCLFGEMDVCRCLANISPNIHVVVYICSRKMLFDAQSSVRSGESGTAHYTHTYTHRHTLMDLWARRAARFLSLSVSSLPSIGGVGAINQAVWEGAE